MLKVKDFKCNDCGDVFEKFVKKNTSTKCPSCGSDNLVELPAGSAFKVMGHGAYTQKMKV